MRVLAGQQLDARLASFGKARVDHRVELEHVDARAESDDFDVHVGGAQLFLHVFGVVEGQVPLGRVVVAHLDHQFMRFLAVSPRWLSVSSY